MVNIFHNGNRIVQSFVCRYGNFALSFLESYAMRMVTRIGGKRPTRLYIEEWMAKRGLDRKRLAERMGVSAGTITKKLANPGKIDGEWLQGFREALDLKIVEDLFHDPSAPTPSELLRGLSEDEQRQLIQYADFLRSKKAG